MNTIILPKDKTAWTLSWTLSWQGKLMIVTLWDKSTLIFKRKCDLEKWVEGFFAGREWGEYINKEATK